ncbi:hypothetical protein [Polaribacter sp. L3A8]|uniref:hypothetical protein n=1 Tax=Polaribacter sp. L3A8 TaxID=2686361 RepID=UPI00131DD201|nr:hypothetical protein [Polaribacter sp. L3A8]
MRNQFTSKIFYLILILFITTFTVAQDLENIGSRTIDKIRNSPLKINGAISTNGVYYSSNSRSARAPFTYFLQGNINISWLTFSMPLSYSFSNQGSNFGYQTPFKFNRLSIHPKYKWVQAHLGDVNMNFSPYTLNGHQFTGGGVELTPRGSFKISAMYGRLLKATEDDGEERTLPAYKRMGYGTKLEWNKDKYKLGVTGFYAKDAINSISNIPEERNIKPRENLVVSIEGETTIAKDYKLYAEYASTAITQDLRADKSTDKGSGLASYLFNNRSSTEFYSALKAGLEVNVAEMKLGVGFERIEPGYETLGAYYFNNDFENITLNASRTLFNNKVNLSFNVGYQKDNLNNQKTQGTNRNIGALNATYQITDAIVLTGSYSNFSTFTNKSLNQFDDINDSDLTDEDLEALNYKQLSQNSNINLNWQLPKTKKNTQNINLNYSLASSANKENDIIRVGQANNFHNGNAVYTIGFPENKLNISTSFNYNYSDIGRDDSKSWGTGVSANKRFFENKLNSTFGVIYNKNTNKEIKTGVLNFRANASTTIAEKHNLTLTAVQLFRSITNNSSLNELTLTFGYAYAFDLGMPKLKKRKRAPNVKIEKPSKEFQFSYKEYTYTGNHAKISEEIVALTNSTKFKELSKITSIANNLNLLEIDMHTNEGQKNKSYKRVALNYLKYLHDNKSFIDTYHELAFKSLKKLYFDASKLDATVQKYYLRLSNLMKSYEKKGDKILEKDKQFLERREQKYKGHVYMLQQLKTLKYLDIVNDEGILSEFKGIYLSKVFEMLENDKTKKEVENYLLIKFAEFYHKKSLLSI